jgi:hypothetical protein
MVKRGVDAAARNNRNDQWIGRENVSCAKNRDRRCHHRKKQYADQAHDGVEGIARDFFGAVRERANDQCAQQFKPHP